MRSRFLLMLLLAFVGNKLVAQNSALGLVRGTLVDSVSNQNLKSATVSILNPADSSLLSYTLSKEDGSFTITNVPLGSHIMYVTFQGYSEVERRFTISADVKEFNAGKLFLSPLPANLGTVTVRASPIVIKGDTTEFNASHVCYKTKLHSRRPA